MSITVTPRYPEFFATVEGVDLRRELDDGTFGDILDAFHRYAVLHFPGQPLDDDQQIAFTQRFGALERTIATSFQESLSVSNLSNVDSKGKTFHGRDPRMLFLRGNQIWHSDSSFKAVPAKASALSAREVPPSGGETEFADMRAAYEALSPAEQSALEGLQAEHDFVYSQGRISLEAMADSEKANLPPVHHPVIRVHPATGRKSLYIGRHASHIVGQDVEQSRAVLKDLLGRATREEFVWSHSWEAGDLVIWDNRCVLHRGRPWDESKYRRVMHRTTVAGEDEDNPWLLEARAA